MIVEILDKSMFDEVLRTVHNCWGNDQAELLHEGYNLLRSGHAMKVNKSWAERNEPLWDELTCPECDFEGWHKSLDDGKMFQCPNCGHEFTWLSC